MGGAVSAGRDNNELVDNLVEGDYIKTDIVERVFRAVDRADYFLPQFRHIAYKDLAWKNGLLHLSAPCIYSDVMESLKLKAGLSFLNIGSGTGYLSTMAGLILGSSGVNHGIELSSSVVDYAMEKLQDFISNSSAIDEFDFCFPKFVVGNCLCLSSNVQQYDRVYCGAACPEIYEDHLKKLIKVGGILVIPIHGQLLQIRRKSDDEWITINIQYVSFKSLVTPASESPNTSNNVILGEIVPASLQELCRSQIRNILRKKVYEEKPHLKMKAKSSVGGNTFPMGNRRRTRRSLNMRREENESGFEFSFLHDTAGDMQLRDMNSLLNLFLNIRRESDAANMFQEDESNERDDGFNEVVTQHIPETDIDASLPLQEENSEKSIIHPSVDSGVTNPNTCDCTSNSADHHSVNSVFESSPTGTCEESNKSERKRHYSEDDDDDYDSEIDSLEESTENVSDERVRESLRKIKRKSPPPFSEWDYKRKHLSDCLREKINLLPLPVTLKLYVNMNRSF